MKNLRSAAPLMTSVLGLTLALFSANAVAATQTICAGAAIPSGWIKKDMYRDVSRCTNSLSTYQWNVWIIESYSDKVEGASMNVCVGFVPEGWVKKNIYSSSTQCGRDYNAKNNVWTIYKVQATDSKLITCAGYVPTGWLKTDFYDSDNLCGGDPFVQNQDNVWVIERYDNKPEGTTMQVCVGFQPYDWVKTDITTSSVKCGRYTNITNNVWTLYKLRATDDKVTTCSGYVPDNFLKVDFYPQSYRCGLDYNTSTYNMWTIQRYNDKSIGTTLKACAGFTPTGWTRLSISSSSTQCGRGTGLYDNIWTLRRDY